MRREQSRAEKNHEGDGGGGELKIREEEENDSREEMGEKLEGDRGKLTKSRERLS